MIAAVVFLVGGALFVGVQIGRGGFVSNPVGQVGEWRGKLEAQSAQILDAKRDLQERLDALAGRVGQMNAHVIRSGCLGSTPDGNGESRQR